MLAAANVLISPAAITVVEDKSTVVSLRLAKAPTHDVTIAVACSDQTEATLATNSVTFTPADWAVPRKISLRGVEDFVKDGKQSIVLTLASPQTADAEYAALPERKRSVSVVDSGNTVPIAVAPVVLSTSEADSTAKASFWIKLTSQPTGNVTIPVGSDKPWEGQPTVSSVTFTTDTWNVLQRVYVRGFDEGLPDGRTGYSILTGPAQSADQRFQGFDPADVTAFNRPAYSVQAYDGTYTGSFTGNTASGSIDEVNIAAGVVTMTLTVSSPALGLSDAPVTGTGTVSKTGRFIVKTSGAAPGMILRGTIAMDWNTTVVSGTGSWRLKQASGTWQFMRPLGA